MEPDPVHSQFPELHQALEEGYTDSFVLRSDSRLQCISNPNHIYSLEEIHIRTITCNKPKATIYLINTIDGFYRGTLVEYWEV